MKVFFLLLALFCLKNFADICFEPDHYMSYEITTLKNNIEDVALLEDQFIDYGEVNVSGPSMLFNPATKWHNGEEFKPKSPKIHYVGFNVTLDEEIDYVLPSTGYIITNQFESFNITPNTNLSLPNLLLVPSLKNACDGPECLKEGGLSNSDHYLCYDLQGLTSNPPDIQFSIEDQFLNRGPLSLSSRTRFCNPVTKYHNGKTYYYNQDINNHLMCYSVGEVNINKTVKLLNQFGIQEGVVNLNNEICLPASKISLCGNGIVDEGEQCDGQINCSEDCTLILRAFVTSSTYDGDMITNGTDKGSCKSTPSTGLQGADCLCQDHASKNTGLKCADGTYDCWKAWLSDSTNSPSNRFEIRNNPNNTWPIYKILPSGAPNLTRPLAIGGYADLVVCNGGDLEGIRCLDSELEWSTETGGSNHGGVWTATNIDGTYSTNGDCSSWGSNNEEDESSIGNTASNYYDWTNIINENRICATHFRLYCFEDVIIP